MMVYYLEGAWAQAGGHFSLSLSHLDPLKLLIRGSRLSWSSTSANPYSIDLSGRKGRRYRQPSHPRIALLKLGTSSDWTITSDDKIVKAELNLLLSPCTIRISIYDVGPATRAATKATRGGPLPSHELVQTTHACRVVGNGSRRYPVLHVGNLLYSPFSLFILDIQKLRIHLWIHHDREQSSLWPMRSISIVFCN